MTKERKGSCRAIRTLRENAGMTVTELARRMGVAHPTVIQWEQGISNPSAENLARLAAVLDTTTDAILGRDSA